MKRIVREKDAFVLLGISRTKFKNDFVYRPGRDDDDPCIPGTTLKRLRPIPIAAFNVGYLGSEIDELIDALAAQRDSEPVSKPSRNPSGRRKQKG